MKGALFWNRRLYAISTITDVRVTEARTKAWFRLAAKITRRTGKLDSRYTSARAEKSANGSSICWDCSFTPGSYLRGVQRLGWRLGSRNCFRGDPGVRTTTSLYLARGPEWMKWVSLVHKGFFHQGPHPNTKHTGEEASSAGHWPFSGALWRRLSFQSPTSDNANGSMLNTSKGKAREAVSSLLWTGLFKEWRFDVLWR